jgi:hypothetical protein
MSRETHSEKAESDHAHREPLISKTFPRTCYFPRWKLIAWFPIGALDETFLHQAIDFLELEESMQEAPFDRYADLNGLSDLRLSMNTVFTAARRRRWVRQPAKGAIFASNPLTLDVVRMYERLMDGAMVEVRAFEQRSAAAEWLEVPEEMLLCPF